MKIFTLNHFWTHAQREIEARIAVRLRITPRSPRTQITPRTQIAVWLCHSTSTSNCTQIAPFNFAGEPRGQDHTPLTSPTSHAFDFVDIAPQDCTSSTSPTSHPSTSSTSHAWDRDWEMVGFWWIWPDLMNFFWLGFDEFDRICVYLLRNGIIYLFGSWENVRNKKKMCFLYYFQQHNQTLENIFQSIFWNATKHLKIFSFPENSIFSGKYFTWTKHSLTLSGENIRERHLKMVWSYNNHHQPFVPKLWKSRNVLIWRQ